MPIVGAKSLSGSGVRVIEGDCLAVLPTLEAGSVDAVITDPPYALGEPMAGRNVDGGRTDNQRRLRRGGFMGKAWDVPDVAFNPATWAEVLRVLKPGGYMLAFGGSRTQHRLACAIEDGGFEIRDCLLWLYGTGFPKGQGCLKPAYEPIILARKPGKRVLPLGIDECRVPTTAEDAQAMERCNTPGSARFRLAERDTRVFGGGNGIPPVGTALDVTAGRYPANVLHDGSGEVLEAFAAFGESKSSATGTAGGRRGSTTCYAQDEYTKTYERTQLPATATPAPPARFFYTAKASKAERGKGNTHPTVKPLALMRWLVRLACPPGGLICDPFAGSGTTGVAAMREGRRAVLIEREPAYVEIIRKRIRAEMPPPEVKPVAMNLNGKEC